MKRFVIVMLLGLCCVPVPDTAARICGTDVL